MTSPSGQDSTAPSTEHPRVVTDSIEVQAPPSVVFDLLADPRQHPRIDGSGSLRGSISGPDRLTQGAHFGMDMRLFGLPYKIRNTVVELEEDRRIAWRHFGGHRWRYVLEPTARGTRVTESFDYSRYGLLPRLFVELAGFPERNRRGIAGTLVELKKAAEHDARTT
ncbi:SRPBCC family protein [Nocardioides aurantiacus]|uniref:Polyketide cyclase/dehydrase/lipid transport protein n=1 Tax=Nocardioides aurantiacus TaxID=86796 RepID=A0A3N2CYY1_9ACTN|nr:SRPBCC family protein [Nocardioides aurantiacus]ROR92747.1 polyketide cyclase/dehydrase/lipid transport protein [Nocardioides aurantiacus]